MKLVRCLTVAVMTAGLAAVAQSADEPQATGQIPAAQTGAASVAPTNVIDPTAGLADIPENQAEIEAMRAGELKLVQPEGTTQEPAIDAAREARRAAFAAVVNERNAKVEALVAQLNGASGEDGVAIQKQIEAEKKAADRRLLEVQLELATAAGDQAGIENLQAALTAFDAPAPAGQPVVRPVPVNPGR